MAPGGFMSVYIIIAVMHKNIRILFNTVVWATTALEALRRHIRRELLKRNDKKVNGSKFIKG
jgi:hypothetical protein